MTDQQPTAEQLERIARLQQRREPADPSPAPPSGSATGGRLAAAGIGVGALFGMVAFLGFDAPTYGTSADDSLAIVAPSAPPEIAPSPIRIVIHRVPATTTAPPVTQAPPPVALDAAPLTTAPSTTAAPVELTATPIVETITVAAPAPAPGPASAPQRQQPVATTTSGGS